MFTSIMDTTVTDNEQIPKTSPPWVWIGFLIAGVFFVFEVVFAIMGMEEAEITIYLTLIAIPGGIYWLYCIYRIHKILAELTQQRYPVSPAEAAFKHIIPFYNIFWLFSWPGEISSYINGKGRVRMISGGLVGTMLLLASLLRLLFDGAIGLAFLFGVTMYVSSKVNAHVRSLRGITPDQLPPLPDPKIFSQPIEATASAAQGPVEGSRL